jgi:hypothetical protein
VFVRASVADVMEGRVTSSVPEIAEQQRDELPTLAVDRLDRFAGAFRFGVFARGEWVADVIYARREPDGTWEGAQSGHSPSFSSARVTSPSPRSMASVSLSRIGRFR